MLIQYQKGNLDPPGPLFTPIITPYITWMCTKRFEKTSKQLYLLFHICIITFNRPSFVLIPIQKIFHLYMCFIYHLWEKLNIEYKLNNFAKIQSLTRLITNSKQVKYLIFQGYLKTLNHSLLCSSVYCKLREVVQQTKTDPELP